MKKCPNCNKTYMDYDQYCLVCRYKLKFIEGSEKVEYCPEPTGSKFTNTEKPKPIVTCPYCKSTNTKKISGSSRWFSTGVFGLASSKVGKQWHCNSCKSDF